MNKSIYYLDSILNSQLDKHDFIVIYKQQQDRQEEECRSQKCVSSLFLSLFYFKNDLCVHWENRCLSNDNYLFSRVGDCFDPILDPTLDHNPFRIKSEKVGSRSKIFDRNPAFSDFDRQSKFRSGLSNFLLNVRLLKHCKIWHYFLIKMT